jgi:hypothetical protein
MPLKSEGNKKRKPQISLELCGSLLNSLRKRKYFKQDLKMIVLNDKLYLDCFKYRTKIKFFYK